MRTMNITIIGLGLIGGSLGLAIKAKCSPNVTVTGLDNSPETLRIAVERGAVDCSTSDYFQAVSQADLVFLCTPVLQIVPMVKKILPYLKSDAILTDVGSTKKYIFDQLMDILPSDIYYVGGHPMAGSEQSGITAADKDLFKNKWYIVISETATSPEAVNTVREVVAWSGAMITTMDIVKHDQCAAVISHVPHVAAASLVNLLGLSPEDIECNLKLAGGGFRDTTRIASSNADMWADICLTNSNAIIQSLTDLNSLIEKVISDIREGDRQAVHDFFHSAKLRRDTLINASLVANSR